MVYGADIRSKEDFEEACEEQPLIKQRLISFWNAVTRMADQRGWIIGIDYMIKVCARGVTITFVTFSMTGAVITFRIAREFPWIRNLYYGGVKNITNLLQRVIGNYTPNQRDLMEIDHYSVTPEGLINITLSYDCRKIKVSNMSKRELIRKCRKALIIFNSLPAYAWSFWWKRETELRGVTKHRVEFIKKLCDGLDVGDYISRLYTGVGVYNGWPESLMIHLNRWSSARVICEYVIRQKGTFPCGERLILCRTNRRFCELKMLRLIKATIKEISERLDDI